MPLAWIDPSFCCSDDKQNISYLFLLRAGKKRSLLYGTGWDASVYWTADLFILVESLVSTVVCKDYICVFCNPKNNCCRTAKLLLDGKATLGSVLLHFSIYAHKRCLLLCFAFNSVKRFSFKYILMNSPILIFLNSAFKCSTKLSTSLPRINHYKGFGFILQSPTGMFIVLGWTPPSPQVLCVLHRGYTKHEWKVSDWLRETSGKEAGPKNHCVFGQKLSRTHLMDLLESNYVFFLQKSAH